jgi:hypothetical protein
MPVSQEWKDLLDRSMNVADELIEVSNRKNNAQAEFMLIVGEGLMIAGKGLWEITKQIGTELLEDCDEEVVEVPVEETEKVQ